MAADPIDSRREVDIAVGVDVQIGRLEEGLSQDHGRHRVVRSRVFGTGTSARRRGQLVQDGNLEWREPPGRHVLDIVIEFQCDVPPTPCLGQQDQFLAGEIQDRGGLGDVPKG